MISYMEYLNVKMYARKHSSKNFRHPLVWKRMYNIVAREDVIEYFKECKISKEEIIKCIKDETIQRRSIRRFMKALRRKLQMHHSGSIILEEII